MPTVFHDIYVTNGLDYGPNDTPISGSLRWAYAAALDTGDPNFSNQSRLIIDASSVVEIDLDRPLIDDSIAQTYLEIVYDGTGRVPIVASTSHSYRFINHSGNNGITIDLEKVSIESFGSPVVTSGSLTIDAGNGGAIQTVAPLVLIDCGFADDWSGGAGGAIYAQYSIDADDSDFYANIAAGDGGAIYCAPLESAAGMTLTDCTFTMNSAGGNGGAIYFHPGVGLLGIYGNDTTFTMNLAGSHGGAVFQYCGAIEIVTTGGPGMIFDDDDDHALELYLTELYAAHIDIDIEGEVEAAPVIYLVSSIPPESSGYWSYIDVSRVDGTIETNWPIS